MNSDNTDTTLVTCPHCNNKVPKTDFCITCGQKMTLILEPSKQHPFGEIKCPHCEEVVPKTVFCIKCGKSLDSESEEIDKNQLCPLCRQEIPSGHSFCHLCGARLQSSVREGSQSVICNHCWKPNPPNTGYCVHCGATDLGRKAKRSLLLEEPFEGYQVELSQLLKPASIPLAIIRQGASKSFPIKSTISHSRSFAVVQTNRSTLSILNKNLGGFSRQNLLNYAGSFLLVTMIYFYWFNVYSSSISFTTQNDELPIILDVVLGIFSGFVLTSLLMMPIWLATFLVYRKTGYQVRYQLDSSRVLITVIFNLIWIYFGGGPIILRLGDIKTTEERGLRNRFFVKGIAWGSIFTVLVTFLLAIVSIGVVGLVGEFAGFLFQDSSLMIHSITLFFGAIWISLILILPLGDFYDRVLKEWNIVVYFIMLMVILIIFFYSMQVPTILEPITNRA
ncbi:MAG: zinc ribbon domain-containing protein [Candidatus Hodarchaeales archaeon]|jgi:hypothetical protein